MLIQIRRKASHPASADPPAGDYPRVTLVIDALVTAYETVRRWYGRRRNRRLLEALSNEQLRDIGLTRSDIASWSGKLDGVGDRAHAKLSLSADSRCRYALAGLSEEQLCNLSEAGLIARREAKREMESL